MSKVLAIIPARGGSKGVPKKNIKKLCGKPLIQYPIDSAFESGLFDKIVVSTDDDEISSIAEKLHVDVILRPPSISGDRSLVIDAIRFTIDQLKEKQQYQPEYVFLLEPTSPIRSTADLKKAFSVLQGNLADSVATFVPTKLSPGRIWRIEAGVIKPYIETSTPFQPRQEQPIGYELTGQIYAFTYEAFTQSESVSSVLLGRVFPLVSSTEFFVDIDNEVDFVIAEALIKYLNEKS